MEFARFYGNGAVAPQLPRRHAPAGHERRGRVIAAGARRRIAVVIGVTRIAVAIVVSIVRVGRGVTWIAVSAIGTAPIGIATVPAAAPEERKEGKAVMEMMVVPPPCIMPPMAPVAAI